MDLGTLHKKKRSIWPFYAIPATTIRDAFTVVLSIVIDIISTNVSTVIMYLLPAYRIS